MSNFKNRKKDRPYLIAEMACAHQGNLNSAKKLVKVATDCGFDCIQIQIFNANYNLLRSAPLFEKIKNIQFSLENWLHLINIIKLEKKIDLSIFAYDEPSLDFAIAQSPDLIKLNSSELSNPYMLRTTSESKIPFTLGTGASSFEEIKSALEIVKNSKPILMHGMQNFPTNVSDINFSRIKELQNIFNLEVMLADHTDTNDEAAVWIDALAMGYGVDVFEKHIILDEDINGIDSESSLTPEKMYKYVKNMHKLHKSIGFPSGSFSSAELKYRAFQKKYCVSSKNLSAGNIIKKSDVKFLRLHKQIDGVITPLEFEKIQDKMKLKFNIRENDVITSNVLTKI